MEDLIQWSKWKILQIGVGPIPVEPFVTLDIQLATIPMRIFAGMECSFGETTEVGIDYDGERSGTKTSTIHERVAHEDNGCEKTFEIGSEEENEEDCPAIELGFDITVELQVGGNIASFVTIIGLAKLEIPFRLTVPQKDNASTSTSCQEGSIIYYWSYYIRI